MKTKDVMTAEYNGQFYTIGIRGERYTVGIRNKAEQIRPSHTVTMVKAGATLQEVLDHLCPVYPDIVKPFLGYTAREFAAMKG